MTQTSRGLEGVGSEVRLRRLTRRFRRISGQIEGRTRREIWLARGEYFLIWFAGFCLFATLILIVIRFPI